MAERKQRNETWHGRAPWPTFRLLKVSEKGDNITEGNPPMARGMIDDRKQTIVAVHTFRTGVAPAAANPGGCVFRCGRRANPPFTTCCCACPRRHTGQCRERMWIYGELVLARSLNHAHTPAICIQRCGRAANPPFSTCCGACPARHTRECGERRRRPAACGRGCGRTTLRHDPAGAACCLDCALALRWGRPAFGTRDNGPPSPPPSDLSEC